MRIRMLFSMVAVLVLASLSAHAYRLQFKDTAGDVRTYKITMKSKGTMEMLGMSMPMTTEATVTTVEKVLGVNNGLASLSMEMKDGKVKVVVSGLPGEEESQTIEQPMPGLTMTYDRTPLGRVSNLKSSGDLAAVMGGSMGMVNGQMQYPGQGLEFPNRDLKAGETWTGKQAMEIVPGSKMDVTATYTLVGTRVVNGKTYLLVNCALSANVPAMQLNIPAQGAGDASKATMGMTIKGTAVALFDEAAGQLFSETYSMDVAMTLTGMGADAMSGKVKMTMTGEMARVN